MASDPAAARCASSLLSLDRDLEGFLQVLDAEGIDYSVVLTADHGGMDIPERLRAERHCAGDAGGPVRSRRRRSARSSPGELKLSGPVLLGDLANDVWLDRDLKPRGSGAGGAGSHRNLLGAPAGRSRVHRAPDREDSGTDQLAGQMDDRTEGSRVLRPASARATSMSFSRNMCRRFPSPASATWRRMGASGTMTAACRSCSGAKGMQPANRRRAYFDREHPSDRRRPDRPCTSSPIGRKMPEWG